MKILFYLTIPLLLWAGDDNLKIYPDQFLPGWEKSGEPLSFTQNNLYGHINGGAELFLEFGFEELTIQKYVNDDREIILEIYRMAGPVAALGIYLMKCGKEMPSPKVNSRNTASRYQYLLVKGPYYIQLNNFSGDPIVESVIINLAYLLTQEIEEDSLSSIFADLPPVKRIKNSERILCGPYALQSIYTFGKGNILQLDKNTYALAADYEYEKNETITQIIAAYPDEQTAVKVYIYFKENLDSYLKIQHAGKRNFLFKDYKNKFGMVKLRDRIINIRIGFNTAEDVILSEW